MDELAKYNRDRWSELVDAKVAYSQPLVDYDEKKAAAYLEEKAEISRVGLKDFKGLDVLCLASGGGQQTVCFGLLGANVTVIDFTPGQLEQDRKMAQIYGYDLRIEEGDMRDLSRFADQSFDLIYQAYSINFVPDPLPVIQEAARVIRPGGDYFLQYGNPLWNMENSDWNGKGYPILQPYVQGQSSSPAAGPWDILQDDGSVRLVEGPKEFTHTTGTLVNGLGQQGFTIYGMVERPRGDAKARPGSWEHFTSYLPLWPGFWTKKST